MNASNLQSVAAGRMTVSSRGRRGRAATPPMVFALACTVLCTGPGPVAPTVAAEEWPPAPALVARGEVAAGPLPGSLEAAAIGSGQWRCTFRFQPAGPDEVHSVALAGTFNGWSRDETPMLGPDADGCWSATLDLPGGDHQYKFVVNAERWVHDPLNPRQVDDGHSGFNSWVRLGRLAGLSESDAQPGDGAIDAGGIDHDPQRPMYFQVLPGGEILVRVRTLTHDVQKTSLCVRGGEPVEMHVAHVGPLFTHFETRATLPTESSLGGARRPLEYTFLFEDGNARVSATRTYTRETSSAGCFVTPDWAKHAIWYQVFLDRFRNGDPANDPEPARSWTSDWFAPAAGEAAGGQTFYRYYVFGRHYGGDLEGLEQKLPYLQDLGVNALYLNPIFEASENHKYHTISYIHIDDQFGSRGDYDAVAGAEDLLDASTWRWTPSDERFLRFLDRAHQMGFRVIIDGVFNHVGRGHPAFQDVLRHGRASRFADWFDVTSWEPFRYTGWAGIGDLPVFRKSEQEGLASPSVRRHIYDITKRWMDPNGDGDPRDGIDGWRLDVPNEVPAAFWVGWREHVKSINPDAYIGGEIWDRADVWLDGRHFDGVMNYGFARAVVAWTCHRERKIRPSQLDERLATLRLAYPLAATLVLQNLLDSHDTDRIASMARNPDREYDQQNRVQDNGPQYDNGRPAPEEYARARLAALVQMTYIGAPMIYYGDEVGMWGADDPTNRKPMLWEDLQPYAKPDENFVLADQLAYYRKIIALRNAHAALRTGSFRSLLTDDENDVWVFERADEQSRLLVALNASGVIREIAGDKLGLDTGRWDVVFGEPDALQRRAGGRFLSVPAIGGVVVRSARP